VLFTLAFPGTVVVLLPFVLLRWRGDWPPQVSGVLWLGLLPLGVGVALYLACLREFVVTGGGTPAPWDAPRRLVRRGPYAWSRNPMYVGILAALAGEAILGASAVLVGYGALVFAAFHQRVVAFEEPTLARSFGEDWTRYRRAVPRWLGPRAGPGRP
jgi:protein-S-isoprenylcysteine O-methyltransferase Ste14